MTDDTTGDEVELDAFMAGLMSLDFYLVQQDRRGVLQFARRPNRFLTEWVHDYGDDVLFTWEFSLGEYVSDTGWQIGAADHTFQILYPQFDVRLPRDIDEVGIELQRLEQRLGHLDLSRGDL